MSLRSRQGSPLFAAFCFLLIFLFATPTKASCRFHAIFNFGDSNSDTGGFWAAFPAQRAPNGMTYFKKPVGRATDGRLVVDFLAQALGLPFLSPYLQSIGSNFSHGANFATLASTVLLPNTSVFVSGISPFSLAIQFNQMNELRVRVFESRHPKGMSNWLVVCEQLVFGSCSTRSLRKAQEQ